MQPDQKKYKVSFTKLSRILGYLRPYLWLEIEIFFCMLIGVVLTLAVPWVVKFLIDRVFVDKNYELLPKIMLALIGLFLIRSLFNVITAYLFNFVGQRIIFDIRLELFQHLEKMHMGFYHKTKTGEMVSRVNNDVESLQTIVSTTIVDLITDSFTIIGILAIVLYWDWRLTLVSLTVFPLFAYSIAFFGKKIKAKSAEVRAKVADILHFFHETLSGMKLVQAYTKEKHEARRFMKKGREMIDLRISLGIFGSLATSSANFFSALGPALVLWYGGYRVMGGALTIGGLVAFYMYIGDLFSPIFRLARLNVTIQIAMASIERIFDFLDLKSEVRDLPEAIALEHIRGDMEFKNVCFSYDSKEQILSNISFEVRHGETAAIVGPSGVGKTTIINLIFRFYDPSEGLVQLDGTDIRRIKLFHLRKHIGVVSQDTFLFNHSIRENLRYGNKKSSDEEIIEACRKANIHDFIASLPQKYETIVGDRGMRLSGGEQQRLSIARAILKNPKILILDEATSSLDSRSEALIQASLEGLMKERTTIIIAHRLSTIVNADKILVLHKGRIVESGKHHELLEMGGLYQKLWQEQMKRREEN